jgi:hypothetical protein
MSKNKGGFQVFRKLVTAGLVALMMVSSLSITVFANPALDVEPQHQSTEVIWRDPPIMMPRVAQTVNIKVNGVLAHIQDIQPEVHNGVTFVSVEFVHRHMAEGMSTDDTGRVYFDGDKVIVDIDTGQIYWNGLQMMNAFPPYARQNTIMVPLRTMANAFNFRVEWCGDTQTVLLNRPVPRRPGNVWETTTVSPDSFGS